MNYHTRISAAATQLNDSKGSAIAGIAALDWNTGEEIV
jgi:hypothetical protein